MNTSLNTILILLVINEVGIDLSFLILFFIFFESRILSYKG